MSLIPFRNLNQFFDQKIEYNIQTVWTDSKVPWQCYRCPNTNLFYFAHNKCASTLYNKLMNEMHWIPTTTQDIDWQNDIVVSHIRNPLIKHRKGIVEGFAFAYPELQSCIVELAKIKKGLEFLASITSFDAHAYTIQQLFGQNAVKIRWIPIDTELDHKKFTIDVFRHHGATITNTIEHWFYELPLLNQSLPQELELYNLISSMVPPSDILRLIDFDMCLYKIITTPIEPENFQDRVKQLMASGLTEQHAIDQSDQELFSGAYREWEF